MKKFHLLISFLFFVVNGFAQHIHLDKFVTNEFLESFYTNGCNIVSGEYNEYNKIYSRCKFAGKVNHWIIEIETNSRGRINTIIYNYDRYRYNSIISSSSELIRIANNAINAPGLVANRREIVDNPSVVCHLIYEAEEQPLSIYNYKTVRVNASWSYNDIGQTFFHYLTIYYNCF